MPELFRFFGFVFFFYSREHEPLHVHVEGNGGSAKFNYDCNAVKFVLAESKGIKQNDLKRIQRVVDENTDLIILRWFKYFVDEDDIEDILYR